MQALLSLYPDIGLILENFFMSMYLFFHLLPILFLSSSFPFFTFFFHLFLILIILENNTGIIKARKKFFHFAKENGFDPLLPSSWYSIDPRNLLQAKVN